MTRIRSNDENLCDAVAITEVSAEQLLGDHDALDLVGAFEDLDGLERSSVRRCLVLMLSCDDYPSRVIQY